MPVNKRHPPLEEKVKLRTFVFSVWVAGQLVIVFCEYEDAKKFLEAYYKGTQGLIFPVEVFDWID